jgi:segregation and condensation protein B
MSPATAELERTLEGLLFLSADPVTPDALAEATGEELHEVVTALERLREHYEFERRGFIVRELAGGFLLSTHPDVEPAARRLLAKPRTPPLTPAQAETLAIVAYLQPVSRPEIARIRGVSAESAAATLLERGVIEEAGRSQFGAVLYRTSELFLKLFGLGAVGELPTIDGFDPSDEFEQELRERLLRAGEARSGVGPAPDSPPVAAESAAKPEPESEATAVEATTVTAGPD